MDSKKSFGLIIQKKLNTFKPKSSGIFGSDSDEETSAKKKVPKIPQLKPIPSKAAKIESVDPSIYEYDSIYDDMKAQKVAEIAPKEKKSARYIDCLLKAADKRKKEYERRLEKKVQLEREKEGDKFKDKEMFVTSAYKKKMQEREEEEERERRENLLNDMMDVTKQKDLSGFYRHFLKQSVGEEKVPVFGEKLEVKEEPHSSSENETTPLMIERIPVTDNNYMADDRDYSDSEKSSHDDNLSNSYEKSQRIKKYHKGSNNDNLEKEFDDGSVHHSKYSERKLIKKQSNKRYDVQNYSDEEKGSSGKTYRDERVHQRSSSKQEREKSESEVKRGDSVHQSKDSTGKFIYRHSNKRYDAQNYSDYDKSSSRKTYRDERSDQRSSSKREREKSERAVKRDDSVHQSKDSARKLIKEHSNKRYDTQNYSDEEKSSSRKTYRDERSDQQSSSKREREKSESAGKHDNFVHHSKDSTRKLMKKQSNERYDVQNYSNEEKSSSRKTYRDDRVDHRSSSKRERERSERILENAVKRDSSVYQSEDSSRKLMKKQSNKIYDVQNYSDEEKSYSRKTYRDENLDEQSSSKRKREKSERANKRLRSHSDDDSECSQESEPGQKPHKTHKQRNDSDSSDSSPEDRDNDDVNKTEKNEEKNNDNDEKSDSQSSRNIFEKRTVGEVFAAAQARYFQRLAKRSS